MHSSIPKSNQDPTQTSRPTEHIMTELIVNFPQFCQTAPASFPNNDKGRRRSSVSFAENASLQYVDTHENMRDLFYSKHELDSIKHRNARQAKNMILSNMTMDQFAMEVMDTSIFLGLESCLSQSIYHEIFERRKARSQAVLCEHNRQLSIGINDPCMLAKISEVESAWARKRARSIGLLHFD